MKQELLGWYGRRKRALPWREGVTPYRTWVSEIMLQQTTVAAVVGPYRRFLERFPDVASLARAPEDKVLSAWAGLGYYTRARNLRAAAREIMARHGGDFPGDFEAALALPGIGRYTAGAILSIAFGRPYAVVDGNVLRVFARLFGIKTDIKDAATVKRVWALAEGLVPAENPGDWNQALMELGATVCLPEEPSCGACPLARRCAAFRLGLQNRLPATGRRPAFVDLKWTCLRIEKDGKLLLWKRSAQERFLKDLWGLPEARHLGVAPGRLERTVRHTITNHRIALEVRRAEPPARLSPSAAWVPRARLKDYLVSSLWRKCLEPKPRKVS